VPTRERMNWRWMWRRLEAAGRDSVLDGERLEAMPRRLRTPDWLFLAAAAPPYFAGRLRGRAQAVRSRRAAR